MFVDISWKRQLQQLHTVGVAYSPIVPHVFVRYQPNITLNAGWLEQNLITAEIKPGPNGSIIDPHFPAVINHKDSHLFQELFANDVPWRIGLPIDQQVFARRTGRISAEVTGVTAHAARPARDYFYSFKNLLVEAVKSHDTVGDILEDLLTSYLSRRASGQILSGLETGSNLTERYGMSTEALVIAAGTAVDGYIRDEMKHALIQLPDAQVLDEVEALERLKLAAHDIDMLLGVERTDQFSAIVEGQLETAWQEAQEALLMTVLFHADETLSDAQIIDETHFGITDETRAAILQTLQEHAVRMVKDGTIFALETTAVRDQPIPSHIFEDFDVQSELGPKDPWEEIWAMYQPGRDDIVVPGRDYDYAGIFAKMVDPATGRVVEPLSDPSNPDVVVRVPPSNPFPFADEKRRRVVTLSIEKQLLRIIQYFRELYALDIATWSVPQSLQQALTFMYTAIKNKFGGYSLEPYYLRGFRLFRWYAEKTLYEHGKYLLHRVFTPWVASLAAGYLDVPWSGTGVSFTPGKIIGTGIGELVINVTTQVNADATITLTIPANASAVLKRAAGDVTLVSGTNVVALAPTDKLHIAFTTIDSPIEITYLDRDGYWLQEYTITPVFETDAAGAALDAWYNMLMEYYNKHHEHKTKGSRHFHMHS